MDVPVYGTIIMKKYEISAFHRKHLTGRILKNVDAMLSDLNGINRRGIFSLLDLNLFVLLPLLLVLIVTDIILIAYYYSNNSTSACQTDYELCLHGSSTQSSPGPVTCNTNYLTCVDRSVAAPGVYTALVAIGIVAASLLGIFIILLLVSIWLEGREKKRIYEIFQTHKPAIDKTRINPKYSITLTYEEPQCLSCSRSYAMIVIRNKTIDDSIDQLNPQLQDLTAGNISKLSNNSDEGKDPKTNKLNLTNGDDSYEKKDGRVNEENGETELIQILTGPDFGSPSQG